MHFSQVNIFARSRPFWAVAERYDSSEANGQHITRAVGFAILRVGEAVTIDEVIFGEPGDLQILGARSLEGMNLRVDSRAKKLVAGGPILAAAGKPRQDGAKL